MSKKLYIDTNIVKDAIENRKNVFGKPIGNHAADLFVQAAMCKYQVIISTWMLEELCKYIVPSSAKMFFELIKKKTIKVEYTSTDVQEAKNKSKDHFGDALHIILAEKEKAGYIVTRNTNHFIQIGTQITLKIPEQLL